MTDTWHIIRRQVVDTQVAYCGISTNDENFPHTKDYMAEYMDLPSHLRHYPDDEVCGACLLLHMEASDAP